MTYEIRIHTFDGVYRKTLEFASKGHAKDYAFDEKIRMQAILAYAAETGLEPGIVQKWNRNTGDWIDINT